jgi:signal transduction histidine kinase
MANTDIQIQSLSKYYGNLKVLDNVTFEMRPGEIYGLVGRAGAGKSTLLRIMGGVTQPSQGKIFMQGKLVNFSTPYQARQKGIELVHQKPQLIDHLDIIQNIFLGHEVTKFSSGGLPKLNEMCRIARGLLDDFGLSQNLINEAPTNLSNEQRHLIALMRAFSDNPFLLLLDNILPNLNFHSQENLLKRITEQADQGSAIMISSDNLKHLFNITNRILVLYEGELVANQNTSDLTPRDVVELIVGASNKEEITPTIWALESFHKAQQQTEDLFKKQAQLHETLEATDLRNRQLIEKFSEQMKAMDRLNTALQETQRRLMTEREEERKSLARDLHDSVIQDLLGLNYHLEDIENAEESQEQRDELLEIRKDIRQVVSDLRQLCRQLRPPTIDNHGLSSAIPSLAQEWEERTGVGVHIEIDKSIGRLPELMELSIFRIIQEGLGNVAKHANASQVYVKLKQTSEGHLLIHFADDGQGTENIPNLADLQAKQHFGLVGISERVALLEGHMHIKSSSRGGFVLQVELPNPNPFKLIK